MATRVQKQWELQLHGVNGETAIVALTGQWAREAIGVPRPRAFPLLVGRNGTTFTIGARGDKGFVTVSRPSLV